MIENRHVNVEWGHSYETGRVHANEERGKKTCLDRLWSFTMQQKVLNLDCPFLFQKKFVFKIKETAIYSMQLVRKPSQAVKGLELMHNSTNTKCLSPEELRDCS